MRKPKPISQRTYARSRKARGLPGGTPEAVSKAIAEGRLVKSVVVVEDQPKIADPDLADREWAENTRQAEPVDDGYSKFRRLKEEELWKQAQLKRETDELVLAERKGELVRADEVRGAVVEKFTSVKTKLLAVPSRVRQQLPHLSVKDVKVIDDLVREALEELAEGR